MSPMGIYGMIRGCLVQAYARMGLTVPAMQLTPGSRQVLAHFMNTAKRMASPIILERLHGAATLIGNEECHTSETEAQFMAECTARGRPISPKGHSYGELRRYIKFANQKCSTSYHEISIAILDKNVLPGVNGKFASDKPQSGELPDGVYICAAFSSMRVTHGFVTQVTGGEKTIHHGIPNSEYHSMWIFEIMFVRRVEYYVE